MSDQYLHHSHRPDQFSKESPKIHYCPAFHFAKPTFHDGVANELQEDQTL
eukprot:CAMPEP_0194230470 /NCGR_PEP_ID=MMETSP0156-20130528/44426_1 /TAXON_ID=33649 /ORGANISM="Thalassionema nitzschioides, Strain L26-B" /LENGTH=49 /DNA_ID= /DNA_START= /DNA_END= /DNA_ORIENTATION=